MAKKINAIDWYSKNREKLQGIAGFWLLPKKWKDIITAVLSILDKVVIELKNIHTIEVEETK